MRDENLANYFALITCILFVMLLNVLLFTCFTIFLAIKLVRWIIKLKPNDLKNENESCEHNCNVRSTPAATYTTAYEESTYLEMRPLPDLPPRTTSTLK